MSPLLAIWDTCPIDESRSLPGFRADVRYSLGKIWFKILREFNSRPGSQLIFTRTHPAFRKVETLPPGVTAMLPWQRRLRKALCMVAAPALLSGCGDDAELPDVDVATVTAASVKSHFDALPTDSIALDANEVALGKQLFWDPILSGNRDVACASCHHPEHGWADGLFASQGVGATGLGPSRSGGAQLPRNAPSIVNVAFNGLALNGKLDPANAPMFWDNRVNSLEAQALGPIRSEAEMRGKNISEQQIDAEIESRLAAIPAYELAFQATFGARAESAVTIDRVTRALAAFQRSLVATDSPFDRFMRGQADALSDLQKVGMQNFIDAGCAGCHSGPMFSDFKLHVLSAQDHRLNDLAPDTGADGTFGFRTPTLRNLRETAPYMHSGALPTLANVMAFYEGLEEDGSQSPAVPTASLSALVSTIRGVEDGQGAILAFLESLNDSQFDRSVPQSVPSGLTPGGTIRR